MDTSNTVQIIVSSPAFAKLAETWFKKTKNEIIKIVLFVERAIYFNTAIMLTLVVLLITNSEQQHFTGIIRVLLFLSSIIGIFSVFFGCIFFDRFESKFNQLLKHLHIDTKDKKDLEQLKDFGFLESKTKEAIRRWQNQYFNECERYGPLSKDAKEAGNRFSKNYNFLRKFGLVDVEIGVYMKRHPYQPHLA